MANSSPIRILTVGTGAVGSIYSWRLAQTCEVTTVCRSNYQAVLDHGFEIVSPKFGNGVFKPHHVVRTVEEAKAFGPFDFIVVTLKALLDVYDTGEIIAPAVEEGKTTIVLIQNGFGVEPPIVKRFPKNPLVSVVAYIGANQVGPGKVEMKAFEYLRVGTYHGCAVDSEAACTLFKECLTKGGVQVDPVDDIEEARWEKLFWNGAFNPVCALLHLDTTQVMENEAALGIVRRLILEYAAAATAATKKEYNGEEIYDNIIKLTANSAPNYKPSMQLDSERKQPMEVEVIVGTAVRSAKEHGVNVPTLELMRELLGAMNIHHLKSQL
ncbi:hypothetical protein O0I10_011697 [Lichtheimia ornata]|uniref:2-dehydropantoate 2-reductase n=1 Tax=Lichtheimia ornata TaxID=688661 RepID=A0AAD7UT22_9FUNG|nr:uncharacterized protein O0I10_011697 [Lichtheimia ornata]KAJ8652690.1 hypothetical protein O0I10_011697 [Lichtheimia ornata]